MDFASKFVLNNEDVEYECISDEEFHRGMELSNSSGSSSESDSKESTDSSRSRRQKRKIKLNHHWRHNQKIPLTNTDVPSKRWFRRADTNVVSVNFDTLKSPSTMHAGDPVVCSTCNAILSHISKPTNGDDSMVWKCEFCSNTMNVDIVPEEIPSSEEVTYLMEPGMATASSSMSGRDESLIVFCVDTSGSMCVTSEVDGKIKLRGTKQLQRLDSFNTEGGSQYLPSQKNHNVTYVSRLQAMQAAVEHQLGEMAKNFPHRRVALVTFSNDVTIIGDGYQEEITVAGDKLTSMEQLSEIGSKVTAPQAIKNTCKKLGDKVYKLEEGGATALGPALVVAVNMASTHPGSKVILCTDGKANIGLGNLDDGADIEAGTSFYTNIGNEALDKSVSVSVTTIQGTDCKLVHLGQLANKTGGQVNIVDPLNLTKEFGNILADQIIATNVKSKFLVHKALYIVDETDSDSRKCLAEYRPGNVMTSTTITFEFARKNAKANLKDKKTDQADVATDPVYDNGQNKKEEEMVYDNKPANPEGGACAILIHPPTEEVKEDSKDITVSEYPFQLQIEYTDTEGTKALRVITRSLPATNDRQVAESNANLEILGTHAAKTSAGLALQGEYSKSRGKALMNQRLAWRSSHTTDASTERRSTYRNIYTKIKSMENRLQRKQTQEISTRGRTYSDDSDSGDENEAVPFVMSLDTVDSTDGPRALKPPAAPARKSVSSFFRKKSKQSERSEDMEDSLAEVVYEMSSTNQRNFLGEYTNVVAKTAAPPASLKKRASSSPSALPPPLPERNLKGNKIDEDDLESDSDF